MPAVAPPTDLRAVPVLCTLRAGMMLWRVHHKRFADRPFNEEQSDPQFGRGRFDGAPPDAYPFCYAGLRNTTALMERFLRGVPFNDRGERVLRRVAVADHQLSTVELLDDLRLVSLQSQQDLAAVRQDSWLIHAETPEYSKTSAWARWIRRLAPAAAGMIWPSKRDIDGRAVVLFGDRCGMLVLPTVATLPIDLDSADGAAYLNRELAMYKVTIRPPRAL
jgi:hypothetical protein